MQIKTKIVSGHTADSKPVKQEVNGTVILPPLVFPGCTIIQCMHARSPLLKYIRFFPYVTRVKCLWNWPQVSMEKNIFSLSLTIGLTIKSFCSLVLYSRVEPGTHPDRCSNTELVCFRLRLWNHLASVAREKLAKANTLAYFAFP
jgi:hypothetical protein